MAHVEQNLCHATHLVSSWTPLIAMFMTKSPQEMMEVHRAFYFPNPPNILLPGPSSVQPRATLLTAPKVTTNHWRYQTKLSRSFIFTLFKYPTWDPGAPKDIDESICSCLLNIACPCAEIHFTETSYCFHLTVILLQTFSLISWELGPTIHLLKMHLETTSCPLLLISHVCHVSGHLVQIMYVHTRSAAKLSATARGAQNQLQKLWR